MRSNWTLAVALGLLVIVGLLALTACPRKGIQPGGGEVMQQPAPAPEPSRPPAEALPPPTGEEAAPGETPAAPPEGPPGKPTAVSIDGFESLVFGMTKDEALAKLPFGLTKDEGMEQPDFPIDGAVGYMFKVPYSKYPLLHPIESVKGENFGIAVIFWEGKFQCLSVMVSPKHVDPSTWQTTVAELSTKYGEPANVTAEKGEVVTMWMDAKGRAVAATQVLVPQPDSYCRIDFQSDTWLAQFAEK